ncbi:hypothetical protein INT45_006306, partial [Circinella minor]
MNHEQQESRQRQRRTQCMCGSTTHLNRNDRDCPSNRRNNNNERNVRPRIDLSNNDPILCPNSGSTTHSDPSHAECTSTNINSNNNNDNLMQEQLENLEEEDNGAVLYPASTPVFPPPFPTRRCPKCGSPSYFRATSGNCPFNRQNAVSEHGAQFRIFCQDHFKPENILGYNICYTQQSRFYRRHIFPRMNSPCPSCGAQMWINERLTASSLTNPRFGLCCLSGKINLPIPRSPPQELLDLITNHNPTNALSVQFHTIIRAYNSLFASAPVCANYDPQL